MATTENQTEAENANHELPERSFGWKEIDSPYVDGVTMFAPDSRVQTNRTNYSSVKTNQIAYIPVDTSEVLEGRDTTEIEVPKYFSRFDEMETHVCELDTGHGRDVAWGISPDHLEDCIRVAAGGGRYRASDLSVTVLDSERVFVVEYDGETWIATTTSIGLPDDYDHDTTKVQGFTVPDDDESVLRGIERFIELLPEHYDEEIVAYDHLTDSGYHYFERSDGSTVGIKGHNLKKLGTIAHTAEEVKTDYEIETEYGEQYEVSWDDVTCEIGDSVGAIYGGNTQEEREQKECVAGYQMRWEDPRTSSRVSMNGKIKCKATYYYLLYRENYDRYEVRDCKETIGEFDPENKNWTPF